MADMGAGVGGNQGGVGRPAMCWTPVMFAFVLHRFADLVGEGVKTDKGFKEVHVNSVARQVSEFSDQEVTGTQVYNHMRKWRQRWVKVCKLKELNGALWDEDNYSILLADEHLLGYTKDHPKEAEFLNTPIENYIQLQIVFGSGVTTGRFTMGSNEPFGKPVDLSTPETQSYMTGQEGLKYVDPFKTPGSQKIMDSNKSNESFKGVPTNLGKRKRVAEADRELCMLAARNMPSYVVFHGRNTGVYESWGICNEQVSGCPGASCMSCPTRSQAEAALS